VANNWQLFELSSSSGLIPTGISFGTLQPSIEQDGSYVFEWPQTSSTNAVYQGNILNDTSSSTPSTMLGPIFNDRCSAIWYCSPSTWMAGEPTYSGALGSLVHLSSDKKLAILYDGNQQDTGYHLGAVNLSTGQWQWKTLLSRGALDGKGTFDSNVRYAGEKMVLREHHIIANFHGEFYLNVGQANQFFHYYDDGLFIGEFGTPNLGGNTAGSAGNSYSPDLVRVGSSLYLYHNDESYRGSQGWRIDNVDQIQELTQRVQLPTSSNPALPVSSMPDTNLQ
jgi:hypothetical protein